MSKFSNTKLLLVLVALGAVIGIVKYFDSRKGERNFRSELVDVDTSKISSVYIYPKSKKGQEVKLFKEGGQWKVRVNENKNQRVDTARIRGLFTTITGIKPGRLAARTTDKWKELEVDTSGTRVKVNEGDKKTLDITIGKFNFIGGRDVETFVRLEGDDETYAVNGFLDATFNGGIDDWRDKTIIKGDKDSWTNLSFALGDTMRYQLVNQDSVWRVDGVAATDNQKVTEYFNSISTLSGNAFIDDVESTSLGTPQGLLEIEDSIGNKIKVEAFTYGGKKILRSSVNADNLINGESLWEKVFADKFRFLQVDTLLSTQ